MSTLLAPTTVLEAVNQMLSAIGESPVNTVEDSGVIDAVVAQSTLHNVSREVQQKGWHWNTEIAFTLVPTLEGEISIPKNTLKIDTVGASQRQDVVQRGLRLYDRVNHTYTFTQPVIVDMVVFLGFDELPEAARNYITLRAARRFQQNTVGSVELSGFEEKDEVRALVDLQNAEAENADYRMLDNRDVYRVVAR